MTGCYEHETRLFAARPKLLMSAVLLTFIGPYIAHTFAEYSTVRCNLENGMQSNTIVSHDVYLMTI